MSWTYRVVHRRIRLPGGDVEDEYAIHEYYTDPTGWTEDPVGVIGNSIEDLHDQLHRMLEALDQPVVEEPDDA